MIKAEIDITEPMNNFYKFAEQKDLNHATDAIILICQKTLMKSSEVLNQIIEDSSRLERYAVYDMACQILTMLENERVQYQAKTKNIEAAVSDAEYCLNEIKKSGNPAVIKNYVAAIRKNLDEIENIL